MAENWYPIIDYSLCAECGVCIEKCPHSVYDHSKSPTPVVTAFEKCVDHCHGCGNRCPQGAITYLGDDTGWTPPNLDADMEAPLQCCCESETDKIIKVDFLFLDINSCERCKDTSSELAAATGELSAALKTLGYTIDANIVEITSPELAEQYRFVSSPTIRINGRDICSDVRENECKDCGDLCGDSIECRVFEYEGREYNSPPKAMIIDGILKAIYQPTAIIEEAYVLPENLKIFFEGIASQCCDTGGCSCG